VLTEFLASAQRPHGLVVFSGAAYTQTAPLDYGVLKEVIRQLRTGCSKTAPRIGDALASGLNRLRDFRREEPGRPC